MSSQFYYRYIRVAKIIVRHESILAPGKSLNTDDVTSRRLGIFHLDDARLYKATREKLPTVITVASSFMKNPNRQGYFHAPTF